MVYEHLLRNASISKVLEVTMTNVDSNVGDVVIATVTNESLLIDSLIIYATGTNTDMTSCATFGGAGKVITFIDAATALGTTLSAEDKQIGWTGAVRLGPTETIVATFVGTAATHVNLLFSITYHSTKNGGYLV